MPGKATARKLGRLSIQSIATKNADYHVHQHRVLFNGKDIGFVERGHRRIDVEFRQAGIFSGAMHQLEANERKIFKNGDFHEYREEILARLLFVYKGEKAKEIEDHLLKVSHPIHIDYALQPSVGLALLRNNYSLIPPSRELLEARGLEKNADAEAIARFLKQQSELKTRVMMVFEKPGIY
ncbi:MAG: hypothetical protein ABIH20_01055 [Candidatus Diapherotrites archaeon]